MRPAETAPGARHARSYSRASPARLLGAVAAHGAGCRRAKRERNTAPGEARDVGRSVARTASRILARDLWLLRPATTETLSTATLPLPPQQGGDLSGLWLIFRKSQASIGSHFANFGKCFGNGLGTR